MPPEERDLAYLCEMRESANDAMDVVAGLTFETLRTTKTVRLAAAKPVELVGEAASRLSAGFCAANPEVPWPQIIGLRHRLVHDYRRIDLEILWNVLQTEIPALLPVLDRLIAEVGSGGEADGS